MESEKPISTLTESEFKKIFDACKKESFDKAKLTDVWDVLPCGDNHYNFVNKHGFTIAILPAKEYTEAERAELLKLKEKNDGGN